MAARTDKTLSNNASVQYGVKAISELNAALAKQDSSTVYGVLALVTAHATELVDGRMIKQAAFGTDRKAVGEALANLADNVFGFDSVNSNKPEQKHTAQIKRCTVIATYLMHDFAGSDLDTRVKMSAKGNKLVVAGRFLIDDAEDAEYDTMLTITGARGRALSDLERAAKAWFKKSEEVAGNATNPDDTRKKRVADLASSMSGQAKLADVLTEEVTKAIKRGDKVSKDMSQSLANLKATIQAATAGEGDTDSDTLGEIADLNGIVPYIDKQPEQVQDALYDLYMALDNAFARHGAAIAERNEKKNIAA